MCRARDRNDRWLQNGSGSTSKRPFLSAIEMDRQEDEIRQKSTGMMMLWDDIVTCSKSSEQFE